MKKKNKPSKNHVLYLGDWVFHVGPIFIETPFGMETKDADLHFYGSRLVEAIEPLVETTCMANWELYRMEPGRLEKILERSAGLIISDVEAKCFHLYLNFFDRSRRENRSSSRSSTGRGTAWLSGPRIPRSPRTCCIRLIVTAR